MSADRTYFRVGLDDETTALLLELSEACHCAPDLLLASLARGVLVDDAAMHPETQEIHAGVPRDLLN